MEFTKNRSNSTTSFLRNCRKQKSNLFEVRLKIFGIDLTRFFFQPCYSSDFPISIDLSTIFISSGIYRYHIRKHVTIGISIAIELVQISKLLYFENLTISAIIRSIFSRILPFGQYLYL